MNRYKVKAISKLTRAKHFIVITEDEAFLQVDMGVPTDINNTINLAQQRASLDTFKRKVDAAIRSFDKGLAKKSTKKGKRIPVTKG